MSIDRVAETAADQLIGREHPAALLRAEISRAIGSHGGLVLVTGEAGIGKTTLVTSAAREARRQGALVVGGACWGSGSAPGYWPWTQVVRALRRGAEPGEWAAAEHAAGADLTALLNDPPPPQPPSPHAVSPHAVSPPLVSPPLASPPDVPFPGREEGGGRGGADGAFRVYDAVTSALVALAQRRPVVVVIDDLHVADPASLRLLEFAAQQTWFERLLLIGTYRDTEVESTDHPLRDLLSPLVARATTIALTGLDRAGVAALLARTAGQAPPPGLVAEVHARTGGNPFFVEQTARLWRGGGSADAIAPGVRDALLRRLSLLPPPVAELLPAAAVLGREFHRQVLAAAVAAPVPHVDRLLEQAVVARLVVAKGGGVFAFAHDLVRETLYDSLADPRPLHAAVVAALDRAPGLAGKVLPGDLARHAHLAGERVAPARAVEILLAAARDARGRMAGEEQLGHLRRAYETSAAADPRTRVAVALDLGRELHHSGEPEEARQMFERAAAVAAGLDDPEPRARVALTFHSYAPGPAALELLRAAHVRLVGHPVPDERLALDLVIHLARLARQGGDDDALVFSLWAHHDIIWGPGTARERVALTGELVALARRTSDSELEHFARALRWVALIEAGDAGYLDQFQEYAARGRRSEQPHLELTAAVDGSILAALAGRFATAESLLDGIHFDQRHEHFVFMLQHHRWAMAWLRGRVAEQAEIVERLRGGPHPGVGLLEALTALQAGDVELALRRHADGEPAERMWHPLWLRFLAELGAATGDPELCAAAREAMAPHRGQWVVSLLGWDISGPYDLWLALVDAAEERWDAAVAGFTAARRSADRLQARPWSVLARAHLAETLLARRAPGDAATATALVAEVRREATELDMRQVLEWFPLPPTAHPPPGTPPREEPAAPAPPTTRDGSATSAAAVGHPGRDGPATSAPTTAGPARDGSLAPAAAVGRPGRDGAASFAPITGAPTQDGSVAGGAGGRGAEFRREGAVWALVFAGRAVHVPDAKGLRDLHLLLSRPGEDVPAVRLLAPEGGEVVVAARRMGGDALLDQEARSRYQRHLARLDEEIDRAVELGDDRRAAAYDRERAALLAELRAAAGLGGRGRRLGDEAERARKTVTARIRDVLRKLDRAHPELAAHLRAAVSTGSTCRYQPPAPGEPAWRL
ncbi:AAA family ATPase [Nonomuraea sp. NPDC050783]|uniref:AAA family ATPase n=1 Tax=Nonomuraea sp. NPDC050783 TaxID=3154634 RepID=UPI0034675419